MYTIQQTSTKSMDFSFMYTLAENVYHHTVRIYVRTQIYNSYNIRGNEMFMHALLFKLNAVGK